MTVDAWYEVKKSAIQFTKTQRHRTMLNFSGYRFVQNRQSTKNIFWRCSRYVKHGCRASCVTAKDSAGDYLIRLSGAPHTHAPEIPERSGLLGGPVRVKDAESGCAEFGTLNKKRKKKRVKDTERDTTVMGECGEEAKFGTSQRGALKLIYRDFEYIKDRDFPGSTNWRCSLFKRLNCRARAITKMINGKTYVRPTNHQHNHTANVYRKVQKPAPNQQGSDRAVFGTTRRGNLMLLYDGYGYVREKQKGPISNWKCAMHSKFRWTFVPAALGKTRRGQMKLFYGGNAFTRDRKSMKTCNWKCSLFTKYRCRARAVTKEINGVVHVKVTNDIHFHPREEYMTSIKRRNKTFENGARVNWKCRFYHRLQCKARAMTMKIDGCEYVKVTKGEHSHPKEEKTGRRKRKIKQERSV
uniref:FLYWCH-type domain-containing protein n=1 Tax=Anopheles atroparvus TaxID=41427 RepID=A0A182J4G6_ANOAO